MRDIISFKSTITSSKDLSKISAVTVITLCWSLRIISLGPRPLLSWATSFKGILCLSDLDLIVSVWRWLKLLRSSSLSLTNTSISFPFCLNFVPTEPLIAIWAAWEISVADKP